MEISADLLAARRQKLDALKARGVHPYGGKFPKTQPIRALVDAFQDGATVTTAGRLIALRGHGAITFGDLRDGTGKVQVCFRQDRLGEEDYQLVSLLDLGDWLGVEGTLFKTRTGEVTINATQWSCLAKSLRPLPEKWHGLKDVEIRYRQRYLDLIANEPVRKIFEQRPRILDSLRSTLNRHEFLEVETPMMHPIAGGAAGEPFVTHHAALDMPLYLRLAPELYLKRLLVGGFEKIYEINRSFRNEGLSTKHNPEFTMLEAYEAYGNYETMMTLVEELICEAARAVVGSLTFEYQGQPIDLTPPWERVSFAHTMQELGLSATSSAEEITRVLEKRGVRVKGLTRSQLVRLIEQVFDPKTKTKPLFVTDYWTELSPLAKAKPEDPLVTERFELFIGGMEVANAYSELNDPIEQRRRFEAQLQTSVKQIDEDFLEALEYGMPPAGGLGVGVDRLVMLLLNQPSIKDVMLFPLLKKSEDSR